MISIPKISKVSRKKHAGQSVAIVNGAIVAYGKNSLEAEKKATEKGFKTDQIMTTFIMGDKPYAL